MKKKSAIIPFRKIDEQVEVLLVQNSSIYDVDMYAISGETFTHIIKNLTQTSNFEIELI